MPKWFDWAFPIVGYGFFGLATFLHGATFLSLIGIGQRLIALEIEREEGAA